MSYGKRFFISGATGQLGGLVIEALLRTVPADGVVAGVRDPEGGKAQALRNKGVTVRLADYDRPDTLRSALAGIDRLLLVSGSEIGQRTAQHGNVIDAAKAEAVELVAYTSILHADTTPLALAAEHRATEALLRRSGLPAVLLRNGWYSEVFTWRLPPPVLAGAVLAGAAGSGRISAAARADYAEAAAAVLTGDNHAGHTYELAGDAAFTLSDLADLVAGIIGKPFRYRDMTPDAFAAGSRAAGVPETIAAMLADIDAGVVNGALFDDGGVLARLIGRPTTPFGDTIAAFLREPASTAGH